ncbi:MAG: biotin transporter BioY [Lachnospiraceae bacterium]|nr:biotin transporter BioY [Lachnospiraceae bacterium]
MDNKIKMLTTTALMAAVICVLGPLSIPIGPVPVSLTNFAIYITMYVLDLKRGAAAYCIYMLIGLAGLPVFSGFTGGPAKLFGPTGGYIIGFLPMAIVIGLVFKKYWNNRLISIAVMELATWIPYILGTVWLSIQAGMTFKAALAAGVLPFIIIDLIKIVIAAFTGPVIRTRIKFLN